MNFWTSSTGCRCQKSLVQSTPTLWQQTVTGSSGDASCWTLRRAAKVWCWSEGHWAGIQSASKVRLGCTMRWRLGRLVFENSFLCCKSLYYLTFFRRKGGRWGLRVLGPRSGGMGRFVKFRESFQTVWSSHVTCSPRLQLTQAKKIRCLKRGNTWNLIAFDCSDCSDLTNVAWRRCCEEEERLSGPMGFNVERRQSILVRR